MLWRVVHVSVLIKICVVLAHDTTVAGPVPCSTKNAEGGGGSCRPSPLLRSSPMLLQLRVDGSMLGEVASASDAPVRAEACADDPSWRDPVSKAACADWRGYHCSLFKYGEELQRACPVSCGLCDPKEERLPTTPPTTLTPSGPRLPSCDDVKAGSGGHSQAACLRWRGQDCSGYPFSEQLEAMCPEECGLC